ncbi:MAG TPA: phosphate acetyltransferase [Gemmatimonadaceae bacterium]|jgi:phosphate acetyltransferase|nr:phosphate acetyltransferase [Gemmatimonadaceae bacterium]
MSFLDGVVERASASVRRIVFPESGDERTRAAVTELARRRVVDPILVLDPSAPETHDAVRALDVEVRDPLTDPIAALAAEQLFAEREAKGLARGRAAELLATPLYFAGALVASGAADGCVAGAVHSTGDVLRAALWMVGRAREVRTISSSFYMVVPPFRGTRDEEVLTFTDCAVVRYPTATELADIAIAAARDRRRIVGDEPLVALLSFSTHGSASGESIETVRAALAEIRARAPDLAVDGELQGDAAVAELVAARKAPASPVAGRANVLVFPSLDAGNIAYKLVQRLAGAHAVGPIVQGLRRPCSDLSRGAVVDDIFHVAAITALQAADALVAANEPRQERMR